MNPVLLKGLYQLEQILELELREMQQFLGNRFSRLNTVLEQISYSADAEDENFETKLTDREYELYITSQLIVDLLRDLTPYVSNPSGKK
jgi:hypothetical protein